MKETNMEHYRGEIEDFMKNGHIILAIVEGKPVACKDVLGCIGCEFKCSGNKCEADYIKWLMSEYKPEPVLTAREKGFVECVDGGWIVRDRDGFLHWCEVEPMRISLGFNEYWKLDTAAGHVALNKKCFPFVAEEDEKPWSVEELRKLKVQE